MKVKFFDRDMNLLDIRNCQEVSYTRQKNKEYSISFTPVVEKGYDLSQVYFVSFLDDSKGNRLPYSPCGKLVSVSLDGKCSAESIEKYLADVSVLPDKWQWWKGKSLKRVIENHVYGFRTIRFASESELNVPFDSHHIDVSVLENGNGEVFAGKGHYWSENNPYELYFYSDGYVIYRIEIPTEARRQDMVLRWGDVTGGATDINVQFSWSDNPNAVGAWTTNVSPLRGEGFTPNETEGIDIPEGNKKYLFIRFNLTYDTGEISTAYPRGINYGKEITTNREDGNNYVYYGTTAILNYFEVIYRTNTFVKVGTVAVSDGKALGADIFDKENLLESLKAISEAYNLVFFCQIDDGVITLNCFDSYIEDRTNEFIISDTKNMRVGKKDVAIDFIQAVEAYGAGSDNDRIHTFVEYTQDVTVNNVKKFEDSEAHTIEELRESALQYIENENNDITNVNFEYYAHSLSLGDKVKLIVDKKAITSVVTEEKISASVDGIKKEYVIGVKEYPFRTLFANPFSGKFLEKPKVPTNFVVTRMADGWHATWKGETEKYILRYRRSDTSPYNTHTIVGQQFVFPYTEYEKAYEFVLFAVGENGLASDSTKTTEVYSGVNNSIESIVNGTADVGRPDQLENVRATASRDGISFYCDILGDGLKNTLGRIDWEIKASGEQWASARKISTTVFAGTYNFDRVRDGYPEKDAVGLWEVRAKAVNGYGFESEFYSAVAVVNADNYGTWIQEKPTVFNIQSANRAVNVSWQRPANSLGKEIYGLKYYEIQISKNGTNWHKPAVNKTGKDSESDWYDGTGQLRNDSANYTQSLPLTGQTLGLPENTTYYFRVRTVGETNTSDWSDTQTGIALATGIGDIIAKTITEAQLDNSSVTTEKLKAGAITTIKISDDAITTTKIVNDAIKESKIAANAVTTNKISNAAIIGTKIADNAIEMAKFASGIRPPRVVATLPTSPFTGYVKGDTVVLTTDSKLYRFNGTAFTKAVDAVDIVANSITAAQIATGAISTDELAANAVTAAKIAANTITANQIASNTITAGQIASSAITSDEIAANAVITEKINAGAVIADKIASNAVTTDKLLAGAVTTGKLSAGAVTAEKVYAKAITTEKLDTNAVTTEKINAGAIIAEKIASDAVTTEKLNVLAVNKINSFVKGKNDYWTTSPDAGTKNCTIEVDAETDLKCGVLSSNSNGATFSNKFEVLPDDIFEVNITFYKNVGIGRTLIGLQHHTEYLSCQEANFNTVSKSWSAFNNIRNFYFYYADGSTTRQTLKSYIVGYNVTPDKIPAPNLATACARMLPGQTKANLRILNYDNAGTTTKLYILAPRVTNIASGQLLANQIVTPSLSAINANVGEITSGILRADIKAGESKPNVFLDLDMEEFRVGNKPSLEDNNHEDAEYLHWKPNQGLFLKLKNLIVDALASTIRGRFRVRGSTAIMAQSVLIVNPESTPDPETNTPANTTDIKTALRCPAGITANLTGNATTATTPLYQWTKKAGDLYRNAAGESPPITHYWYKLCKITTAMTFDIEVVSDFNHPQRASYRLSVSPLSPYNSYSVSLFNLGQSVIGQANLAVALDADGYLYIQTNARWECALFVTLLYSASSDFSVTMDKLGYAPFGTASGFTPVNLITQTGAFKWTTSGSLSTYTPTINTNIIGDVTGNVTGDVTGNVTGDVTGNVTGDVTGNADTATKLATARKINGVNFDGTADVYDTYSTAEHRIGTWIDGKPIYRKVINFGALPNNTTKTVAHGISNLGKTINLYGVATKSTDAIPLAQVFSLAVNKTNIIISAIGNATEFTAIVIIEYTKTTD